VPPLPPARVLPVALLVTGLLIAPGCRNRNNLAGHVMDDPADSLAEQRCGGGGKIVRLLLIEWPAPDRASLATRLQRNLLVVHHEGCTVDVLADCTVSGTGYGYHAITPTNDSLRIRTKDELHANLPLSAFSLEAPLAKTGELNLSMTIVGNYEAERSRFDVSDLEGRCEGATHVVSLIQVGAFEFYSGSSADLGADVEVEDVDAGGRSSAQQETLNRDGDPAACEAASTDAAAPPQNCGALLRLELSALDGVGVGGASGAGSGASGFGETSFASPEDEALARSLCEIQIECDANTLGQQPATGDMYDMQMSSCMAMTKLQIEGGGAAKLRECVDAAPDMSCIDFTTCASLPSFDEGLMNEAIDGKIGS
jgi:hypothetical protein